MQQHCARRRPDFSGFLGIACVVAAGAIAALAITQLAGTKTGLALAIAAIGGPAMAYIAIFAPLTFPFGLYVLAIPFDNLLELTAFGTLTKLMAIASGAALLFYMVRTRRAVPPPRALLIWCALYAWAAATTFWAINQTSVFDILPTSVELLILYAAVSILPADRQAIRWVALATVVGGVAAAAYGAYLFHNPANVYYGSRLRITTETSAIDPNHFAAAMLLPIALCVSGVLSERKLIPFAANLAALGMLFLGVTLSQSRGAVLAITAMLTYFLIRSSRGRLRLLAIMGATAATALLLRSQTDLWSRFGTALSTGGAGRTSIWRVGLVALKSHWLVGAGYNNFPFAYDQAYLQTPHQMWSMADWHRAPHNLLIGTSVELGIIGLLLLLVAWFAQFRMLRDIGAADPDYPIRVALEAAVLGTFVAALFLDVMIFKYVWLTFMLMALVRNAHYVRRASYA